MKNKHILGHHVSTVAQNMDLLRTSGFYCEIVAGTTKMNSQEGHLKTRIKITIVFNILSYY